MAEEAGFEPACPLLDNRISSAARYGHFATLPSQKTTVLYPACYKFVK